ncbi:hypothetical protein GGR20_002973 [Devosia subaequoris]|uniref:Uncharacterized protein n=1 Tax=Devosia subaequoris TaxID=395930 RepID=A0A7W6IQH6_9HYPH|nr:hypothetical protein [Devosia subaequoris]MBB4053316.1 hypothetical protein [Devosia subaequoris]MCP1210555.1 hypothetical protein [Devosia subaequoris]
MNSSRHEGDVRAETDRQITENGQSAAERVALGRGYSSILRIAAFVLLFIVIGGTIFYLVGSSG